MKMTRAIVLAVLISPLAFAAPQSVKLDHVTVRYDNLPERHARALAETIQTARDLYATDLHFDMPATIHLTVNCGPDQPTRLFNDGKDSLILSIPSADSLQRPTRSGTFHLYGLCHELGHLAMYRPLQERDWMTGAAAEGWAHYAGSVVVDRLHAKKGDNLWPDPYDYRADGVARLTKQLAANKPDDITRAAGLWQQLEQTLGQENMPRLFAAWQSADVDPAAPAERLLATLHEVAGASKKDAIDAWWKSAAPLFVQARPPSEFKRVEIDPKTLEPRPLTLKEDDDAPDGKKSIAGGGHARQFQTPAPGQQWYLRAVHVHAARYGPATNGDTPFDLALCDKDMKPIAVWKHPYKLFDRAANAKWVRIETPPTLVPDTFQICLVFRPTAQSGVFVSLDNSTTGHSRSTTPGAQADPMKQSDWMIRADLSRPKSADALKGQ
jgi:hypothetical protein